MTLLFKRNFYYFCSVTSPAPTGSNEDKQEPDDTQHSDEVCRYKHQCIEKLLNGVARGRVVEGEGGGGRRGGARKGGGRGGGVVGGGVVSGRVVEGEGGWWEEGW